MKKGTIVLTEEQANVLIDLLDVATKTLGLKAAGNALTLTNIVLKAFEPVKEEEVTVTN